MKEVTKGLLQMMEIPEKYEKDITGDCYINVEEKHFINAKMYYEKYTELFQINKSRYPFKLVLCVMLMERAYRQITEGKVFLTPFDNMKEEYFKRFMIKLKINQELEHDKIFPILKEEIDKFNSLEDYDDIELTLENMQIYFKYTLEMIDYVFEKFLDGTEIKSKHDLLIQKYFLELFETLVKKGAIKLEASEEN